VLLNISCADFICTMTVVDMSYHSTGLRVLYFARALEMLPWVRALGDIIRFHRIMVKLASTLVCMVTLCLHIIPVEKSTICDQGDEFILIR
jgi:hypothetical protein